MNNKISASDEIDAYCSRCKLNLRHIVIAMVGEKIVKMQCRTCGGIHGYRSGVSQKKSPGGVRSAAARIKTDPVQTLYALWEKSMADAEGKEVPYAMDRSFREGDIVNHPVFGKGIVLKAHYKKCAVLFRDAEKTLVSANT